jgi:hypothetical protein
MSITKKDWERGREEEREKGQKRKRKSNKERLGEREGGREGEGTEKKRKKKKSKTTESVTLLDESDLTDRNDEVIIEEFVADVSGLQFEFSDGRAGGAERRSGGGRRAQAGRGSSLSGSTMGLEMGVSEMDG